MARGRRVSSCHDKIKVLLPLLFRDLGLSAEGNETQWLSHEGPLLIRNGLWSNSWCVREEAEVVQRMDFRCQIDFLLLPCE